jgi:hypothetical protein
MVHGLHPAINSWSIDQEFPVVEPEDSLPSSQNPIGLSPETVDPVDICLNASGLFQDTVLVFA